MYIPKEKVVSAMEILSSKKPDDDELQRATEEDVEIFWWFNIYWYWWWWVYHSSVFVYMMAKILCTSMILSINIIGVHIMCDSVSASILYVYNIYEQCMHLTMHAYRVWSFMIWTPSHFTVHLYECMCLLDKIWLVGYIGIAKCFLVVCHLRLFLIYSFNVQLLYGAILLLQIDHPDITLGLKKYVCMCIYSKYILQLLLL